MSHTHENTTRSQKIKPGSDRSFGVVFGIVFFIVSVSPLLLSRTMRLGFLAVSVVFVAFAILEPKRLAVLNRHWTRLGFILGAIFSPIILGILFFVFFLPIGLLLRLFGKDVLNLKWQRQDKSYWIMSGADISSMKDQF